METTEHLERRKEMMSNNWLHLKVRSAGTWYTLSFLVILCHHKKLKTSRYVEAH